MAVSLKLASPRYVLENGRVTLSGPAKSFWRRPGAAGLSRNVALPPCGALQRPDRTPAANAESAAQLLQHLGGGLAAGRAEAFDERAGGLDSKCVPPAFAIAVSSVFGRGCEGVSCESPSVNVSMTENM